jgi:hypothetical protein
MAWHFLNIITNQIKAKVFPKNKSKYLKIFIKKCFALMVDGTDLKEIETVFAIFVFVINSPSFTATGKTAVNHITENTFKNEEVKKIYDLEVAQDEKDENGEEKQTNAVEPDRLNFFEHIEQHKNKKNNKIPMFEQSKFYQIFVKILAHQNQRILEDVDNNEVNPFYVC